jgi:hypothetical protein
MDDLHGRYGTKLEGGNDISILPHGLTITDTRKAGDTTICYSTLAKQGVDGTKEESFGASMSTVALPSSQRDHREVGANL